MTVESTIRKESYAGGTGTFTFSFRALTTALSDIKVVKKLISSGAETTLTYGVDYTVDVEDDGIGGTVTASPSISTLYTVTVYRETTDKQESDYDDYNQFPADTLETDLDRRTMLSQEVAEDVGRAAKLSVTSSLTEVVLPDPVDGKTFKWSGTGGTLVNSTTSIDDATDVVLAAVTSCTASATLAGNYASTASTQATAASASATLAGLYASTSSTQAALAALYASTSSTQASTATAQAVLAGLYASTASTAAVTSTAQAVLAANYATTASTAAITASTAASTATAQAVLAALYASTASTQAILAGNYATTASNAATSVATLVNGSTNPTNLLSNGDFESWSAGTAVAPDGWTLVGAGATVAREATIINQGTYSAKITRAGTDCYLWQDISAAKGIGYWKNKTVTFTCSIYATVAVRARIFLFDGISSLTISSYHSGDSTYQKFSITKTIDSNATSLYAGLYLTGGDTSAYFDGAMLVEGSTPFAFADKPAGEGVWANYGAVSTVVGWTSTTTKNIYIKKIGKTVFVAVEIVGTSNSTSVTFTTPYTASAAPAAYPTCFMTMDNGTFTTGGGVAYVAAASTSCSIFKDMAQAAFTNSGEKRVHGILWYESA